MSWGSQAKWTRNSTSRSLCWTFVTTVHSDNHSVSSFTLAWSQELVCFVNGLCDLWRIVLVNSTFISVVRFRVQVQVVVSPVTTVGAILELAVSRLVPSTSTVVHSVLKRLAPWTVVGSSVERTSNTNGWSQARDGSGMVVGWCGRRRQKRKRRIKYINYL